MLDSGRQALPFMRSLGRAGHHVTVACAKRLSVGYFCRYANKRLLWPNYFDDPDGFAAKLLEYVRREKPDVTISVGDISVGIVADNRAELAKYTRVTAPNRKLLDMAADKVQTMLFCMDNDIPCPKTFAVDKENLEAAISELEFPVMVKPRRGIGALGLRRVETSDELCGLLKNLEAEYGDLLIQEFIPQDGGTQFQAEAFCDADGKMIVCMVILKPRFFPVTGGTSTANVTIDRPDIQEYVRRLLEGIGWKGAADVDFILDPRDNVPKVLEINPRVTAGIKIGFKAGIDYADLHMKFALGQPLATIDSYKLGVYSRNLIMDILWFIFADRKTRKSNPVNFFKFFGKDVCYQTFGWDDPLPFLGFFLGMARKYASPSVWRAKLGKGA